MARRLDWTAHYFRKRKGPIITEGQIRDFRREGCQLAVRIEKGKKSPRAGRDGPVRQWTPEEIATWAAQRGLSVNDRTKPDNDQPPW